MTTEVGATEAPSRTPIDPWDLPPAVHKLLEDGGVDRETWRSTILDPAAGHQAVFFVRFAPGQSGSPHWHTSDTLYVFLQGELSIPDEGTFRAGQVRWVPGGLAYGPELAGPEGCAFLFASLGPFGTHLAEEATEST